MVEYIMEMVKSEKLERRKQAAVVALANRKQKQYDIQRLGREKREQWAIAYEDAIKERVTRRERQRQIEQLYQKTKSEAYLVVRERVLSQRSTIRRSYFGISSQMSSHSAPAVCTTHDSNHNTSGSIDAGMRDAWEKKEKKRTFVFDGLPPYTAEWKEEGEESASSSLLRKHSQSIHAVVGEKDFVNTTLISDNENDDNYDDDTADAVVGDDEDITLRVLGTEGVSIFSAREPLLAV